MFLPIGDSPNPINYKPFVNWTLIATNVAIYLLISLPLSMEAPDPQSPILREYLTLLARQGLGIPELRHIYATITSGDLMVFTYGYKPGDPSILSLFTGMFLHGGLLHLAGNMLFLWIFGDNVEHRLGRIPYLIVYLFTGAASTLIYSLFAMDSLTPLVGASGAISGVLGLYFLLFARNRVKVFVFLFPFITTLLIPARFVLGFYVIVENLFPFLMSSESSVAYGAHLGGFFAGLGVAWIGEKHGWRWPEFPPQNEKEYSPGEDNRQSAQYILDLKRSAMAAVPPNECVTRAKWLVENGQSVMASRLLKRCIATQTPGQDLAEVYLELGLTNIQLGQPTAAYQHFMSVFDFDPAPEIASRTHAALSQINIYRPN